MAARHAVKLNLPTHAGFSPFVTDLHELDVELILRILVKAGQTSGSGRGDSLEGTRGIVFLSIKRRGIG